MSLIKLLGFYLSSFLMFAFLCDGRCLASIDYEFHVSSEAVIREVKTNGGIDLLVLIDGISIDEFNMKDGIIDYRLSRKVTFVIIGTHVLERNFVYCLSSDLFMP